MVRQGLDGCEVWGLRWWEIMNYWQGQQTLSFSDVTGSLSSSFSREGLVFTKIHKLMRWSIFNLPTEIHFMSSIFTSCPKYSPFTGTESILFLYYIHPGSGLVFKTCQFCFYEEIISIWGVECWLFRFPRRNWSLRDKSRVTHIILSAGQTLNNLVIIRHNKDFCKRPTEMVIDD